MGYSRLSEQPTAEAIENDDTLIGVFGGKLGKATVKQWADKIKSENYASEDSAGVVKIGEGITIDEGKISAQVNLSNLKTVNGKAVITTDTDTATNIKIIDDGNVADDTTFSSNKIDAMFSAYGHGTEISSWEDVHRVLQNGYGKYIFSLGDELTCGHESYGTLTWQIVDVREKHLALRLINSTSTQTVQFGLRNAIMRFKYDLAKPEEGKARGFRKSFANSVLPESERSDNNAFLKTYSFFPTVDIPAGSYVITDWWAGKKPTSCYVYIYSSRDDDGCFSKENLLEKLKWESGYRSTDTNASASYISEPWNYDEDYLWEYTDVSPYDSIYCGNSEYADSIIRKFLNCETDDYIYNTVGLTSMQYFYHSATANSKPFTIGLDSEFLKCVSTVKVQSIPHTTDLSEVTETNLESLINVTEDKFFLPSVNQLYGGTVYSGNGLDISENVIAGDDVFEVFDYFKKFSKLTEPGLGKDSNRGTLVGSARTLIPHDTHTWCTHSPYFVTSGTITDASISRPNGFMMGNLRNYVFCIVE